MEWGGRESAEGQWITGNHFEIVLALITPLLLAPHPKTLDPAIAKKEDLSDGGRKHEKCFSSTVQSYKISSAQSPHQRQSFLQLAISVLSLEQASYVTMWTCWLTSLWMNYNWQVPSCSFNLKQSHNTMQNTLLIFYLFIYFLIKGQILIQCSETATYWRFMVRLAIPWHWSKITFNLSNMNSS